MYFKTGKQIYDWKQDDPVNYLRYTFGKNGVKPETAEEKSFVSQLLYWKDDSAYTIVRLHSILSLFTGANYNLHVILWQFFSFIGLFALFKSFEHYYPKNQLKLIIGIFLIPSTLFWISGVHKEALSIFAIGLGVYCVLQMHLKKRRIYLIVLTLFALLLLSQVRLYLLLILIPCLIAFYFSLKDPDRSLIFFIGVLGFSFAFVLLLGQIHPAFNIFDYIIQTQIFFNNYAHGYSDISIPEIEGNVLSLLVNTPGAFLRSLCRPSFFDLGSYNYYLRMLAAFEVSVILLFIGLALFYRKPSIKSKQPLFIMVICFSVIFLCLLGLVISNLGALSRYKSIILPLIMPVVFLHIDFDRLRELLNQRVFNKK